MKTESLRLEHSRLADVNVRVSNAAKAISTNSKTWCRKVDSAMLSIMPLRCQDFPEDLRESFDVLKEEIYSLKRASNGMIVDTPNRCKSVAVKIVELHHAVSWHAIHALGDAVDAFGGSDGA